MINTISVWPFIEVLGDRNRSVIVQIDNNPIICDCNLHSFLRHLEGNVDERARYSFRIVLGELKCQGPKEFANVLVDKLNSKDLKCLLNNPDVQCPDRCTCWMRPEDKGLLIDCAYQNLTQMPKRIGCLPDHHVELNLTGNYIKEIPVNTTTEGYDYVTSLILTHNDISILPAGVFSPKLKVNS